jgi:hypothetical protein
MANFKHSSTQKATLEPRYDADGKVFRQAIAHGALTALTPYFIIFDEYGPKTAAVSDVADTVRIGVPAGAVSSGAVTWLQTGGPISDVVTPTLSIAVGHALKIHDGAIADVGADYTGSTSEWAVCTAASTSATTQDVFLVDREILTTT